MPEEKVSDDPNAQNQDSESSKESKQDLPLLSSFSEEEEEEEEDEVEEEDDNGSDDSDNDNSAYVDESDGESADDDSAETTVRMFNEVLDSKQTRKREEEDDRGYVYYEDLFDFPKDPEKWREEDLKELWADGPIEMTKPGWDPVWADEEDWEIVREEVKAGRDPPIAPFYLPFRRYYPAIPDNHFDISSPKSVIEEMDRIEEFMNWVSYIFPDGSSYEGTVWDDLAHGKGVYVAEQGLVRYEGEWLQNNMEGHGIVEVEIPDIEPVPGSKLEAKMRAEGKIISRDFMSPEDKRWLEMDIEDSIRLAGTKYEIPFYENEEWVRQFGKKPEKGRYRYAGQWKHGRMHGCGVYEVNERIIYGRFYFGEHLEDSTGCDADVSGLHAGIAEVAAAKARMFVNKPDGMVREERGPYGDPQHPYLYEEDDVWMAPGFINQFYEVPDYWKTYVREVDQEREMWLNSFYKAPLRIPMPAELEYWWATDKSPEFVLVNKEPEPDPEDPSKLIYSEDPLILHTPTGRFINFVEDEEHGVRLFWQPNLKDGEDVDPAKVEFLPLGYDEFFGRSVKGVKKESKLASFMAAVESACRPFFERLEKWTEEKKKESEMKLKLIEQELEFIEAELCLEEAMEDMEMELKMKQKEEEKKAVMDEKAEDALASLREDNMDSDQEEEEDEDEESPTSFGSVLEEGRVMGPDSTKDDKKGSKNGKSTFAATSMSFASCSLASVVPLILQESFVSWKKGRRLPAAIKLSDSCLEIPVGPLQTVQSVHFPCLFRPHATMRVAQEHRSFQKKNGRFSQLHSLAQILSGPGTSAQLKATSSVGKPAHHHKLHTNPKKNQHNILSMHVPLNPSDYCTANFT